MSVPIRVAVLQTEPVWLGLNASVKKGCTFIAEAAMNGAKLIAFSECWIPGYPAWIWQGSTGRFRTISDLNNVVKVDLGPEHGKIKVGCLACWEHTQPLFKYHSISQGEVIHIAMWPPVDPTMGFNHPGLWSMTAEGCQNLSQTYAIDSTAYVLHCTSVCTQKGIDVLKTQDGLQCRQPGGGHSCVVGPDGRRLTESLGDGKADSEGIVYADLDLSKIVATRGFLDIVGHYSRPDPLWLGVDKEPKKNVVGREQKGNGV